jgi:menaquinone-dependent protoporphyrinogen IX oxidase
MNLLVTYASKYCSTAEIAEVIGGELDQRHCLPLLASR